MFCPPCRLWKTWLAAAPIVSPPDGLPPSLAYCFSSADVARSVVGSPSSSSYSGSWVYNCTSSIDWNIIALLPLPCLNDSCCNLSSWSTYLLSITSWIWREAPDIIAERFFVRRFWLVCKRVYELEALRGCSPFKRLGCRWGFAFKTLGRPFLVGRPYSYKRF